MPSSRSAGVPPTAPSASRPPREGSGGGTGPASFAALGQALRLPLLPALGGLVALAWAALFWWESSPYGRYLHHGELAGLTHGADATTLTTQTLLYVAGWLLMCVAMMLPTTAPLIAAFHRLTAQRHDRLLLSSGLVAGYLSIWLGFGIAAHFGDWFLHEAFERNAWLQANPWIFGAGPLVLAGAFQFSPLKYRCLERCRAPVGFIFEHWRGGNPLHQAVAIGAHHGLFCVGCCWALMLLMFAVGTGNVGWMLALGAVMAIEKNHPWGRHLSAPLGIALIAWGAAIALDHAWSWQ